MVYKNMQERSNVSFHALSTGVDGQALDVVVVAKKEFLAAHPSVHVLLAVHDAHTPNVVHHLIPLPASLA
jgi:hypothetical protein